MDDLAIMQQLSSDISMKVVYVTHHWEIIMCMSVCVCGGGGWGEKGEIVLECGMCVCVCHSKENSQVKRL